MTSNFYLPITVSTKEVAALLAISIEKAREEIKRWKRELGLAECDYFTFPHLSTVLKMELEKLIETICLIREKFRG